MTLYNIYLQYDDGKTIYFSSQTVKAETKEEALRLCKEELKWEECISAYAVNFKGEIVE